MPCEPPGHADPWQPCGHDGRCATQVKPQAAGAVDHAHSDHTSGEPAEASKAIASEEDANNNSVGCDDDATDSDEEFMHDSVSRHEEADDGEDEREEEGDMPAAAASADRASDTAQHSYPRADAAPAPAAALLDAAAVPREDDVLSSAEAAGAPAGLLAAQPGSTLVPALSPAVPGAWAALTELRRGGPRAAEGSDDTGGSVLEDAGLTPLPDAQLSLSGDRLSNDATCAPVLTDTCTLDSTLMFLCCAHVP